MARESRRKGLNASGITKSVPKNRRRATLGIGVVGDRVFLPGTPSMTLPELLKEAEVEVSRELEHVHSHYEDSNSVDVWSASPNLGPSGHRDPFKTPLPNRYRASTPALAVSEFDGSATSGSGEQPWTKEEWKLLDACFTDERLDIGATLERIPEGTLAPVDMVSVDRVVDRFISLVGGEEVIQSYGEHWSRFVLGCESSISAHVLLLQRKFITKNFGFATKATCWTCCSPNYSPLCFFRLFTLCDF